MKNLIISCLSLSLAAGISGCDFLSPSSLSQTSPQSSQPEANIQIKPSADNEIFKNLFTKEEILNIKELGREFNEVSEIRQVKNMDDISGKITVKVNDTGLLKKDFPNAKIIPNINTAQIEIPRGTDEDAFYKSLNEKSYITDITPVITASGLNESIDKPDEAEQTLRTLYVPNDPVYNLKK